MTLDDAVARQRRTAARDHAHQDADRQDAVRTCEQAQRSADALLSSFFARYDAAGRVPILAGLQESNRASQDPNDYRVVGYAVPLGGAHEYFTLETVGWNNGDQRHIEGPRTLQTSSDYFVTEFGTLTIGYTYTVDGNDSQLRRIFGDYVRHVPAPRSWRTGMLPVGRDGSPCLAVTGLSFLRTFQVQTYDKKDVLSTDYHVKAANSFVHLEDVLAASLVQREAALDRRSLVAAEAAERRKEEAAERARYERLPEIPPGVLRPWLCGQVPESAFVDGTTHKSSGWTCRDVASILNALGAVGPIGYTFARGDVRLTADGRFQRRKSPGRTRVHDDTGWATELEPDRPFHQALLSDSGNHNFNGMFSAVRRSFNDSRQAAENFSMFERRQRIAKTYEHVRTLMILLVLFGVAVGFWYFQTH